MNYVHFALGKKVKSTINVIYYVRVYIAMKRLKHLWTRTEIFLMMMRNN